MGKSARSHSMHTAIQRDLDRMKKHSKQERDLHFLERKIISSTKSNQHTDYKKRTQNHSCMTLDEFLQHERIKQDKIINSRKLANERIRHH